MRPRQALVPLGRQAIRLEHPLDARARSRGGHAQRLAPPGRRDHADADRLAVQQHAVAHRVFQRVRQRVAEVELHANAVVVRILMYIARLDGAAPRDDLVQLRRERLARTEPLDFLKQRLVRDAAVFDDLAQPRADLPRVQRFERVAVDHHQLRLIKRAEQVFAARMVDRHLAADGGIHLRQKGRRRLNEAHPAQIGAGRVARDIADHAAAQRHHEILPRDVRVDQRVVDALELRHALGRLARGQHKRARLRPGRLQLRLHRVQIQRRDVFIRHDHRPMTPAPFQQLRSLF